MDIAIRHDCLTYYPETIVNNESSEIIRMFYTAFDHLLDPSLRESTKGTAGLFPAHLQASIDAMNAWVYEDVNNGVYKAGFATTQSAYDNAITALFSSLDRLEGHLSKPPHTPYLYGSFITEADIRLYTTLIRFDVAYYTLFKCNVKSIRHDYPRLHEWLRRLYWDESERTRGAFKKTTRFDIIKWGYAKVGSNGIVPKGPVPDIMPLDVELPDEKRKLKAMPLRGPEPGETSPADLPSGGFAVAPPL